MRFQFVKRTIIFKDGHRVSNIIRIPPRFGEDIPAICRRYGYYPNLDVEDIIHEKAPVEP